MSSFSQRLDLPFLSTGVGDSLVVHNSGLLRLDAIVQASVKSRSLSSPPGSVGAGDTYIVKATGTGSWAGKDNQLAYWSGSAWVFVDPTVGLRVWDENDKTVVTYVTGGWVTSPGVPCYSGQKTGTQVVSTTPDTWLDVEWDSDLVDISNSSVFEHDTSTNSHEIVIREAGTYEVHANILVSASGATVDVDLRARLQVGTIGSPSTVTGSLSDCTVNATGFARESIGLFCVVQVSANQELRLQVARETTSASTTITVEADTRILVKKL